MPLKVPKGGTDYGRALQHFTRDPMAYPGAAEIVAAGVDMQKRRDKLATIEKLNEMIVEDAFTELVEYEHRMGELQRRLDQGGIELGQKFRWRDAWKQHAKAEQADIDFERAAVLFNAAAAQCYMAARARDKGPQAGGLKQAVFHFQQAAALFESVHALVKAAIWGLSPRWDPQSLSLDLTLDVVGAMRDLMLAQAQRTFYDKAISEGLKDGVTAKLAAGAAAMFGNALRVLQKPDVSAHMSEESGLFSKGDKSWLTRVECSQHLMQALAEEHIAKEHVGNHEYGQQVARLTAASREAAAAARAAAAGLHGGEKKTLQENGERVARLLQHATEENRNIYQDDVPPNPPAIEAKQLVKPTPPPPCETADVFMGVLPTAVTSKLEQHHAAVHEKLHSLSAAASQAASDAEMALRQQQLPEALDACEDDKHLPERLVAKLNEAKRLGGVAALRATLEKCNKLEGDAESAASVANAMLSAEDDKDAALMGELASFSVEQLASGQALGACRGRLQTCRSRVRQATSVTASLQQRFEKAADDIAAIESPLDELNANLPHPDGTTLEQEPCVPELRRLLEALEAVKADGAAALAAAYAMGQQQKQGGELGEQLLRAHAEGTLEAAAAELLAPLEAVKRDTDEREARRQQLLQQLTQQAALFHAARRNADAYEARTAYLAKLGNGASEAVELHRGLTEGAAFYESVVRELRNTVDEANRVADQRERERQAIKQAARAPPPPPPPQQQQQHQSNWSSGRAQVQAATAFMNPPPSPYPGGGGGFSQATPYPSAAATPYPSAAATPYPSAAASPYPSAAATPYQQNYAQQQRPQQPQYSQPVGWNQQPQAHAQPQPRPQQSVVNQATPKIMCYQCRRQFQVPAGTTVVACPYCQAHNRVPGS